MKRWLYTLMLLMVSTIGLYAQEKVDSLQMKPKPRPETVAPVFSADRLPLFLLPAPDERESKEEMAARINRRTIPHQSIQVPPRHRASDERIQPVYVCSHAGDGSI